MSDQTDPSTHETERTYLAETDRPWDSLMCLLVGCDYVGHTAYKLKNDLGRAIYGDLCERCGRFKPRSDGKERFERGDERTFSYPEPSETPAAEDTGGDRSDE